MDEQTTKKEPIIETSNLNRDNKTAQHIKASALSTTAKPELSRRERCVKQAKPNEIKLNQSDWPTQLS
jgi:hypothetical protein